MKSVAAALLMVAAGSVQAQTVLLHGPSYHSNGAANAHTLGLGYVFGNGFGLGAYRNSEGQPSAYGSWTWRLMSHLDLHAVLATGYSRAPIVPGLLADVHVPLTDVLSLHVMGAPTYDAGKLGVMLHAVLGLRLPF